MEKLTDDNGTFSISGHGLGLSIMVSKKGYYHLEQSDGSFGYATGAGTRAPHRDPLNPAIFVVRKMGQTEPLIAVTDKDTRVPKDGTPVGFSLAHGRAVAPHEGDINVETWINDQGHQVNSNQPYDWRCRVTVLNGGLTQRSGQFDFEAPEYGYQPADEIQMPATLGPKWRSQVSKDYFVKLAGGNYARVEFRITAGGEHFFTVTSYVNPKAGDRNLEFDPGKALKPGQ